VSIVEQIAIVLLVPPFAAGFFLSIAAIQKRIERKRNEQRRAAIARALRETSKRPQLRLVKKPPVPLL
jgi:hypothetical protein